MNKYDPNDPLSFSPVTEHACYQLGSCIVSNDDDEEFVYQLFGIRKRPIWVWDEKQKKHVCKWVDRNEFDGLR